jgi:chemotaxis signal transduction protein
MTTVLSGTPAELYLVLRAGARRYALPASEVLHVRPGAVVTGRPIQLTWHGRPLQLTDLREPDAVEGIARPPLLVVRTTNGPAAVLVDQVLGLIRLPGPCPAEPTVRVTSHGMLVTLHGDALARRSGPALHFAAPEGSLRPVAEAVRQVLAFSPGAGPLRACVPLAAVAAVTRSLAATSLLSTPAVAGVVNWQGHAVPLVALDRLLRLRPAQGQAPARTLICRANQTGMLLGIPASRVWEILPLAAGAEPRPLPEALGWARPLLRGVYLTTRGPLGALDLDAVAAAAGLAAAAAK